MQISPLPSRPELHLTAETGVLEAPAGAVIMDGALHVFHQFRARPAEGSRWAHQYAPQLSYGWDVCDDLLAPQGNEIDVLAGASVPIGDRAVELFFVTTYGTETPNNPELQANNIARGLRGKRTFQVQRAVIEDLTQAVDVSDEPTTLDSNVTRLGPITIDDEEHPLDQLVTPSVIEDATHGEENPWLMMVLNLRGEDDADIAVLRSTDRQNWVSLGAVSFSGDPGFPEGRPFAPRIVHMTDSETGAQRHVIFVTFPAEDREVTGYVVGDLRGAEFVVEKPFQVLDYGYDFTRPRIIQHQPPIMLGLVGSDPEQDSNWANCLSSPRNLTLTDGTLFQDVIGAPRAVKHYSDHALLWTAQLDAEQGDVTVEVLDNTEQTIATVTYSSAEVSFQRGTEDPRVAPLTEADSDSLTIFIDGPLCEVYADGGATTLTSNISASHPVAGLRVSPAGGAKVLGQLTTQGRELQRSAARTGDEDDD